MESPSPPSPIGGCPRSTRRLTRSTSMDEEAFASAPRRPPTSITRRKEKASSASPPRRCMERAQSARVLKCATTGERLKSSLSPPSSGRRKKTKSHNARRDGTAANKSPSRPLNSGGGGGRRGRSPNSGCNVQRSQLERGLNEQNRSLRGFMSKGEDNNNEDDNEYDDELQSLHSSWHGDTETTTKKRNSLGQQQQQQQQQRPDWYADYFGSNTNSMALTDTAVAVSAKAQATLNTTAANAQATLNATAANAQATLNAMTNTFNQSLSLDFFNAKQQQEAAAAAAAEEKDKAGKRLNARTSVFGAKRTIVGPKIE